MSEKENNLSEMGEYIKREISSDSISYSIYLNELTVTVDKSNLIGLCQFLKDDSACLFSMLVDLTAIDKLGKAGCDNNRFDIVYNLLSVENNQRIRIKLSIDEDEFVPTVTNLWESSNWSEREVWDMYGIGFSGHPDLRRILTDYGFDGNPLRKDFPLSGNVQVRYDQDLAKIIYEPVDLVQDFRNFDNLSPWSGMVGSGMPNSGMPSSGMVNSESKSTNSNKS